MTAPVVCGIDGSRASFAAARLGQRLAWRLERRVDFVHVTLSPDAAYRLGEAAELHDRLGEAVGEHAVLRFVPGTPAERLVAISRHASLLLIGTRGCGALRQAVLGSVSAAVTRSAAAPVIVVPSRSVDVPRLPSAWRGVICGVRDEHDVACAGTAGWMARDLGVRLTLVHVVPHPRLPVAPAGGAPPPGLVRTAADQAAAASAMLDQVASAIAPSAPTACRTLVVDGPVGPQLERLATAEDALLVALGPSTHGPLAGALARSAGPYLMRRGSRPVMVCPSPDAVLVDPDVIKPPRRDAGPVGRRAS